MEIHFDDINPLYIELSKRGYIVIRDYASANKDLLCYIEADLHHNELDLINEVNIRRHHYYLRGERGLYLEKLIKTGDIYAAYIANREYSSLWKKLEQSLEFKDEEADELMDKLKEMAEEYKKANS